MRHGTSNRRQRNRNNNGRRNNNQQRTQVYDSNGPDVRIRGNANQVAEKYLALAKDATSSGDHIVAENYFQHAEHYIRLVNEASGGNEANKISNARRNEKPVSDDAGNVIEKKETATDVEDLSLPASILGESQDAEKKVEEDVVE